MRSKPHNWPLAVWLRLQEPRAITLMQTIIYGVIFYAGVTTVINPPAAVEGQFGLTITLVWAWIATVGGLAGALACPFGKWLIEKPAIILCATASAMYAGIVLTLHIQDLDNGMPQVCFVIIALLYFASRYARIRPFSYQPGK